MRLMLAHSLSQLAMNCLFHSGTGRGVNPNQMAAILGIHRSLRAKQSVDINHVYRVMFRQSPPEEGAKDMGVDAAWLLRSEAYDKMSVAAVFAAAKDAMMELGGGSDADEIENLQANVVAANPGGVLDELDDVLGDDCRCDGEGSQMDTDGSDGNDDLGEFIASDDDMGTDDDVYG